VSPVCLFIRELGRGRGVSLVTFVGIHEGFLSVNSLFGRAMRLAHLQVYKSLLAMFANESHPCVIFERMRMLKLNETAWKTEALTRTMPTEYPCSTFRIAFESIV